MRTPAVMIIGMVLPPCGLVLTLTSTFAPDWRVVSTITGRPVDLVEHQGIWDICEEQESTHSRQCGLARPEYFQLQQVTVAKGMMVSSMIVTLLGIALASLGVRCWQDEPSYKVSGLGGLVIFVSGLLSLIPLSWYTYLLGSLAGAPAGGTVAVGYSLVLGYLGSCFQLIGGFSLLLCFVHTCQEWLRGRGKASPASAYHKKQQSQAPPYGQGSRYGMDYSVRNGNYRPSVYEPSGGPGISLPWTYNNPLDVTEGERRPKSQLSSLPCDSDLL